MQSISAFDMIKTGIGPSSSHTMGPWLAGNRFAHLLATHHLLTSVVMVEAHLYGSLAKTGHGHGTDVAVLLGLEGADFTKIDTDTIPTRVNTIRTSGYIRLNGSHPVPFDYDTHLRFEYGTTLPFHANGMCLRAHRSDGSVVERIYYSLGGGFVAEEGEDATQNTPAIVTPYPCHSGAAILENCARLGWRVSDLVLYNEQAWRTEPAIRAHALGLWQEMQACIYRGINKEGTLPGGLEVQRRAASLNRRLLNGRSYRDVNDWLAILRNEVLDFNKVNKWISCFALAVNEENASFGRVITAPTNGASGVLPAVLMYAWCFLPNFAEEEVIRFLLTAGEIGTLFKKNATISAAMGGCQAEIGVSSAMAAAGLTECLGGTPDQVLMAAEIAMEHHLGMTCDPVGGLVQIPCIERNTMGAIKAITASNIALESDPTGARVSLDTVIQSMWDTARDMHHKYKETSEGGLATHISVSVAEC